MKDKNAFPMMPSHTNPADVVKEFGGLTKRELFAAMAMQGDITFWRDKSEPASFDLKASAPGWIAAADALIAALEPKEESGE